MTTAVRHDLTDDYLTLIAGLSHDDLLAAAPATELLEVAYGDRVLAKTQRDIRKRLRRWGHCGAHGRLASVRGQGDCPTRSSRRDLFPR